MMKNAKMDISPKEFFSGLLIVVAVFAVSNNCLEKRANTILRMLDSESA